MSKPLPNIFRRVMAALLPLEQSEAPSLNYNWAMIQLLGIIDPPTSIP